MLTDVMKRLIRENTIALVATVTPEGAPAVSPKATVAILDDSHLAFCDLRSPNTTRNIRVNPAVELNFIDVFRRQACRITGTASYASKSEAWFDDLRIHFKSWDYLSDRMRGIVVIEITRAEHILSPAYDVGAKEEELKADWLAKYTDIIN
ncbi:MAG: pyridoxamine 5'-phosphate oxidase [Rhodospirillaceae bacterium]|nr:pyridoxamine 5'-phosphate oxidase [Rhodospirillaceae bacterium]